MRKAFIVAPNIGLHMGKGGGVRVAVAMAKVFEEIGFKPYLVAIRGYTVERLSRLHGISLQKTEALYYLGFGESARIPFPLQVRMIISFVERLVHKYRPEVVVFHDDIPLVDEKVFRETNVVLYSHFPYAARIKFNVTDVYEIPPAKSDEILDRVYRKALRNLIYVDSVPESAILVANSTVTATFMRKLWNKYIRIVYPPFIRSEHCDEYRNVRNVERKDLVIVLATLQPNKRIGDIIKALSLLRSADARLIIMGHKGYEPYMNYLKNLARSLGVKSRIAIIIDVSECVKWRILAKAKAVISAARFEPFGIAVVEGMYAGTIPIVYRGSLSGPWIDIVERGKYGFGFRNLEELSDRIEQAINDYGKYIKEMHIIERSIYFEYKNFMNEFVDIVKSIT